MHKMRNAFGTLPSSIGLAIAYLMFLELAHFAKPADRWDTMLARPAFIVILPLLAACIPLLVHRPALSTAASYQSGRHNIARRMLLTWLISLLVFISPHYFGVALLDPVLHKTWFLALAPMLLGVVSAMIRPGQVSQAGHTVWNEEAIGAGRERSLLWHGFIGCISAAALDAALAWFMIPTAASKRGAVFDTIYFLIPGLLAVWGSGHYMRRIRHSGREEL